MSHTRSGTGRYLMTPEAARHLGLSARTMEKHRCYGTGPVYQLIGRRIVYAVEDLEAWAALGRRRSTYELTPQTIPSAVRRPVEE